MKDDKDKDKNKESQIVSPDTFDESDIPEEMLDELFDEFIGEGVISLNELKSEEGLSMDESVSTEDNKMEVVVEDGLAETIAEDGQMVVIVEDGNTDNITKDGQIETITESEEAEEELFPEYDVELIGSKVIDADEEDLSDIPGGISEDEEFMDEEDETDKVEVKPTVSSSNKFKQLIDDDDDETDGHTSFSLNIEAPDIIKKQQEHLKEQEKLLREKERLDNTKEFIIEESVVYDPRSEAEAEPKEAAKTQGKKPAKKPAKKAAPKPAAKKKNSENGSGSNQAKPRITKKGLMIGLSVVLIVAIGGVAITFMKKPKENVSNPKPIASPTLDTTVGDPTIQDAAIDEDNSQTDVMENMEAVEVDETLEPNVEEVINEEVVVEDQPVETTEPVTTPIINENKINGVIQNIVVDNVIVLQDEEVIVYSMSDEVKAVIQNFKNGDKVMFEALESGDSWVMVNLDAYSAESAAPSPNNTNQDLDDLESLLAADTTQPEQVITENQEFNEAFSSDFEGELDLIREREIQEALRQSELAEKERIESQNKTPEVSKETLEYEMEAKGAGVLWFRFAWKPNDVTKEVAPIDNVRVELRSPNGTLVTPENASQSGRYWVDKGIVNYAIKSGAAGKWKFVVTKNKTEKLGEIGATVSPGTGFIKIDKVSVQPREGKLLAIWKVSGVKDEELAIEIFAKRGNSEFLIYSANSADSKVYLLDKAEISTQKLEKGTYDIIIKVQDIDAATDKKTGNKIITAKSISDIYEIKNVDIY